MRYLANDYHCDLYSPECIEGDFLEGRTVPLWHPWTSGALPTTTRAAGAAGSTSCAALRLDADHFFDHHTRLRSLLAVLRL